jgi:hypothetical protein
VRRVLLALSLLLAAAAAAASGMSAARTFRAGKDAANLDGAGYRFGHAGTAATLVAIGCAVGMKDGRGGQDLRLRAPAVVKEVVKARSTAPAVMGLRRLSR